jgi:ribonucrease Y
MTTPFWIVVVIISIVMLFIGLIVGYLARKSVAEAKIGSAEARALQILESAERDVEAKRKESVLEAKEEAHRIRQDAERELRERRSEIQKLERRLLQKEESVDRKLESLERKSDGLKEREDQLELIRSEVGQMQEKQFRELERISGLTQDSARELILSTVERESRHDAAVLMKEIEQEAKQEAERRARDIIASAIQRCAADHASEITVSVVSLPNDEMKGRIIGREGRN